VFVDVKCSTYPEPLSDYIDLMPVISYVIGHKRILLNFIR